MNVRLYVEGATRESDLDRTICREAFGQFFEAAGIKRRPRTVPSGGRNDTYKDFVSGLKSAGPNDLVLMLVDSEDLVAPAHPVWQHLKAREGWDQPPSVGENQAYLMVCVMETWFLADIESLRAFFGKNFKESKVPAWPNLEAVPKARIYEAIGAVSTDQYSKGNRSFKLLEKLNPAAVELRCPRAKAFLDRLRAL